jgi:predicted helicase
VERFLETYNSERHRWNDHGGKLVLDDFLLYDDKRIKWSSRLKQCLEANTEGVFDAGRIRRALYRPFQNSYLYFDELLIHRRGQFPVMLPQRFTESENRVIVINDIAARSPNAALMTNLLPDLHLIGSDAFQCFPFYTYAEDGTNRRENITDWALEQFRSHYGDPSITKWDIFHYVYAVLHHPDYRQRYAANLRRELPRIPFVAATSSTLSSRAKQDDSQANHPAESRDPLSEHCVETAPLAFQTPAA